ncbi:MAG: hypothetical protein H6Q76_945 [Firmicutes bacterium]|nr:hypothetical protein [Bacillota bacterium]
MKTDYTEGVFDGDLSYVPSYNPSIGNLAAAACNVAQNLRCGITENKMRKRKDSLAVTGNSYHQYRDE